MIKLINWIRSAAGTALIFGVFSLIVLARFIVDGFAQTCGCDECLESTYYYKKHFVCCRSCYNNFPPSLWNSSESEACYLTCQIAAKPLCGLICHETNTVCIERCHKGWVNPARKLCRRACPYGEDEYRTSHRQMQRQQLLVKRNPASTASRTTWLQVIQFVLTFLLVVLLLFIGIFQRNTPMTPKPFTAKLMMAWVEGAMILVVVFVADMRHSETEEEDDMRFVKSFVLLVVLTSIMLWEVNRPITE